MSPCKRAEHRIMKQDELVTGILYRLKQLARQTGTDVEGVVSWLAISLLE